MKEPQAVNVIVAFFVGMVIIAATSFLVGSANREKWFKKRQQNSFLNRRGMLGEALHFGYPRTWQGAVAMLIMYAIIFSLGYVIIFML